MLAAVSVPLDVLVNAETGKVKKGTFTLSYPLSLLTLVGYGYKAGKSDTP